MSPDRGSVQEGEGIDREECEYVGRMTSSLSSWATMASSWVESLDVLKRESGRSRFICLIESR